MATRKKANAKFADVELGDLTARQRQLEDRLLELRRGSLHKTRDRAHERITESLASKLDAAIREERTSLRHRLANVADAPSPVMFSKLAELLRMKDNAELERVLREDVDRETWRGEPDLWQDGTVNQRRAVEKELAELEAEIDLRLLANEADELERKRKGILERIGGSR